VSSGDGAERSNLRSPRSGLLSGCAVSALALGRGWPGGLARWDRVPGRQPWVLVGVRGVRWSRVRVGASVEESSQSASSTARGRSRGGVRSASVPRSGIEVRSCLKERGSGSPEGVTRQVAWGSQYGGGPSGGRKRLSAALGAGSRLALRGSGNETSIGPREQRWGLMSTRTWARVAGTNDPCALSRVDARPQRPHHLWTQNAPRERSAA
jgi:hypothetical protein